MRSKILLSLAAIGGLSSLASAAVTIAPSAAAFIDISTSGTSIGAISDDSETIIAGATLGFGGNGLLAGGMSVMIGNNGAMLWGTSATDNFQVAGTTVAQVGYYNAGPNNSTTPAGSQTSIAGMVAANAAGTGNGNGVRQFIAPLWDDNTPSSSTGATPGAIRYQMVGADLVVQWTNEDHFAASGSGVVTYQVIFRGGVTIESGLPLVDFVYQDTLYAAAQYQDDGGSAAIGFKNWGITAAGNDVEFGIGGGGTSATADPVLTAGAALGYQPKVAGYVSADNPNLPHAVTIAGVAVPEPTSLALVAPVALLAARRRRA